MFNSSISKKNEFLSEWDPDMNPSQKKLEKIFLKEPKYVERVCVTALKEIILLRFQQWIEIY